MNFKIRIDKDILDNLGVFGDEPIDDDKLDQCMFQLDNYFEYADFYDIITEAYYLYIEEAIYFAKLFNIETEFALLQYYVESYDEYMAKNNLWASKLNRRVRTLLEIFRHNAEKSLIDQCNNKKV
jgi:hypothetical protein